MSTGETNREDTVRDTRSPDVSAALGDGKPQVAGYEILELLGRGGMGRVYKARHQALDRIVALKFLLSDADDSVLARFRTESQAVAQLHHPHIAQVFETSQGVEGQPYFAMEYVEGGSLAQALAGKPQTPLEAAGMAEMLARAIEHCHRQGIIHRDLKPGNVMLAVASDQWPVVSKDAELSGSSLTTDHWSRTTIPKITDFGLAKRLQEGSRLTRTGDVLGTPSYMAPEQASGVVTQIGPGADIYALGAILYEMLTGRPPFQGPDVLQTLIMVVTMDPVPPRRLQPKVPRDLETICLKCLEKQVRKRYASARELADDLHRFRENLPIVARPPRLVERGIKWVRRKPLVAALLAVIVASMIGLVVGFVEIVRANREIALTNENLQKAVSETEETLVVARSAIDSMLVRLADQLAPLPQSEKLRRESLEDAQKLYEKLSKIRPRDAAGRFHVAEAHVQLGKIYRELAQRDQAEANYRKAESLFQELRKEVPDDADYLRGLLGVHNNLANVDDDRERAITTLRQALADAGPLVKTSTDPATFKVASTLHNTLALMLRKNNKPGESEKEHRAALALRQKWAELHPKDMEARADMAASHSNLATVLTASKRSAEAVEHLSAAVYLLGQPVEPTRRLMRGQTLANLAIAHEELGDFDGAQKAHALARSAFEALVADYSSVPEYRFLLAKEHVNLATFLFFAAQNELTKGEKTSGESLRAEASKHAKVGLPMLEKLVGDFPRVESYRTTLNVARIVEEESRKK